MRILEKLRFPIATELMHNVSTRTIVPKHVMRLGHTAECVYCGSALTNIFDREVGDLDESSERRDECTICGWWRYRRWPNHYFNGFWKIGTLHRTTQGGRDEFGRQLEELLAAESTIYSMDPYDFERFAGELLGELYDCEVVHVGKSHDGGVDIVLLDSDFGVVPVQVKRRLNSNKVESVGIVREFRGAMLLIGADEGIIVSTADKFSKPAKAVANPRPEHLVPQTVQLINGRRLLDIIGVLQSRRTG